MIVIESSRVLSLAVLFKMFYMILPEDFFKPSDYKQASGPPAIISVSAKSI